MLRIGIVGCGAIGGSLARIIQKDFAKQARVSALYDIDRVKAIGLSRIISGSGKVAVKSLPELINRSELVIEAASAGYSWQIAGQVLSKKRMIMIMSVGGIVKHIKALRELAAKTNTRVFIPSGAIVGVDGLKAMAGVKIKKVVLTTRKNPRAFKGVRFIEDKKINLDALKQDRVLFSGRAQDAIRFFPQNINVAGVLSIAGIGALKTRIRIIASPRIHNNIHEIEIESSAGTIFTRAENVLHPDNPKTSYLAVLSAVAVLRQIVEPVRIGT